MQESGLELELSVQMSYSDVEAALAKKLGLENPQMLRFTPHNNYTQVQTALCFCAVGTA